MANIVNKTIFRMHHAVNPRESQCMLSRVSGMLVQTRELQRVRKNPPINKRPYTWSAHR
jgi:hypothetical protein